MSKKKILMFFDEDGERWLIEEARDMILMCEEFLDDDLVITYKSTRYFHELEMAKMELIEKGILSKVEGNDYDPIAVLNAAEIMAEAIRRRLGEEAVRIADSEVDVSWKANKPDLSKFTKQK